jgi:hypothetical protein
MEGSQAIARARRDHCGGVQALGVAKAAVQRARKGLVSLAELALAALTSNGTKKSGTLGDLSGIAGWLTIDGDRWRLRGAWP